MRLAAREAMWVAAYLGVVGAPLVFACIGAGQPDLGFWANFSVALGFVGLAMMGLEFALVARFRGLAAPFGLDGLLQFHRQMGYAGLSFVLGHVALSTRWDQFTFRNLIKAPPLVWFGMFATAALVILVATSVWRRWLRIPYEWWHAAHAVLAVVAIGGALGHVFFVNEYVSTLWMKILWGFMSVAFVALLAWVRVVKPRARRKRPWHLESVRAERGQTATLALRPPGGLDFRFEPGQFAWFTVGRSPFSITQHPFSFSSSAERGGVEIAVKALGDFSSRVGELEPGTPVYVDGPHGVFSIDQKEGPGFGLIGGGVGISALLSMLRTMYDRADMRSVVLIYANREWEGVAFRDELGWLQRRMNLTVVHVLEQPPYGWTGERGLVTSGLLGRHFTGNRRDFQFFVCGPVQMMEATEAALLEIDVPPEHIHTERFAVM